MADKNPHDEQIDLLNGENEGDGAAVPAGDVDRIEITCLENGYEVDLVYEASEAEEGKIKAPKHKKFAFNGESAKEDALDCVRQGLEADEAEHEREGGEKTVE